MAPAIRWRAFWAQCGGVATVLAVLYAWFARRNQWLHFALLARVPPRKGAEATLSAGNLIAPGQARTAVLALCLEGAVRVVASLDRGPRRQLSGRFEALLDELQAPEWPRWLASRWTPKQAVAVAGAAAAMLGGGIELTYFHRWEDPENRVARQLSPLIWTHLKFLMCILCLPSIRQGEANHGKRRNRTFCRQLSRHKAVSPWHRFPRATRNQLSRRSYEKKPRETSIDPGATKASCLF